MRGLVVLIGIVVTLGGMGCERKKPIGNTLRIAIREKVKTLDPVAAQDYYSSTGVSRAYEGLLQYHYLKRPYTLEPLLAEALPEISKDQKSYTFHLRKDVFFQDDACFRGKPRALVAADFVYSILRLADPNSGSVGWWTIDGRIAGLNEWRERALKEGHADYSARVEGLQAIDAHTLVLKLTRPDSVFLHLLPMTYFNVVAREAVDFYKAEFSRHPVGTGPFILEKITSTQLVWRRNPKFRSVTYPSQGNPEDQANGLLSDAGKTLPFVDRLVDDIIPEDQPAWLNFMQGNHDYLERVPKDESANVFTMEGKPRPDLRAKGIKVAIDPALEFTYLAFNMEDPVVGGVKNKLLRQAISLALDEAPAIEKFYLGLATKAESPIPPGIPSYDPAYRNSLRQYNLAKARDMIQKAGLAKGLAEKELVLESISTTHQRQIAEYVQRSLQQLGLNVKLNVSSWPEFLSKMKKKQAQMWTLNWVLDYPDAENIWQLLYSKNVSPGSNATNYSNSTFDAIFEKAAPMAESAERRALFHRLRDIAAQDIPWVALVHRAETRMAHPWTYNLKIHAFEHNIEKYLRVDVAARDEYLKRELPSKSP